MTGSGSRRIAVGLSGGVDSSVAAALLVKEGWEVVGLTLKVWDRSRCCSLEDADDARRVARHLGIPFYVLDAHAAFAADVVEPFVRSYAGGRTPNPCVLCNRRIKFGWLLDRSRALGCGALATGHYARLEGEGPARRLRKGADLAKDQSYFLVPEGPSVLERLRFPLGGMTKAEVRRFAAERGLPVARKAESQDVCFLPEGGLASFLEDRLGTRPGDIVDAEGTVLGRHRGVHAYTVGQRRGLGVAARERLHVLAVHPGKGQVVVGPRREALAQGLRTGEPVWLARPPDGPRRCAVKIRSAAPEVACRVEERDGGLLVTFVEPQFGVAPGQLAVFYEGDVVLGGAWIEEAVTAVGRGR
ncbi:MAG: tRNA 2-thiouridine(34) synthase MnmA [Deferrisomatales bacterium]|nr:tRNA 2-thiouridine(34) synthase MnmA [Deferrisomatales bacterium]